MEITRKANTKLNFLHDVEKQMQEKWEKEKIFEVDAPEAEV
jgi:leucyl-tRNA synthetase